MNQAAWRLQPRPVLFVDVGTVHSMCSLVGGRVFDSSEDFRVWERVVSEDLCYHLLHTMNLTDEEI